jgi:hypothetical protein
MQSGTGREKILKVQLPIKSDQSRWENLGEVKGDYVQKLKDQLTYLLLTIYFQRMTQLGKLIYHYLYKNRFRKFDYD